MTEIIYISSDDDETKVTKEVDEMSFYYSNFKIILDHCICHIDYFEEEKALSDFNTSSQDAKNLLIRLCLRKHGKLIKKSSISYKEVGSVSEAIRECVAIGWITDGHFDLEDIVKEMTVSELKSVLKKFLLGSQSFAGCKKDDLIKQILELKKPRKTLLSYFSTLMKPKSILDTIVELTGGFVRVTSDKLRLFYKMNLFFFGSHHESFHNLILDKIGQIRFPSYSLSKSRCLFLNKSDFNEYEKYSFVKYELAFVVEKRPFDCPIRPIEADLQSKELIANSDSFIAEWKERLDSSLCVKSFDELNDEFYEKCLIAAQSSESFLCRFRSDYVKCRIIEWLSRYKKCCQSFYKTLLLQGQYLPTRRGKWWVEYVRTEKDKLCQLNYARIALKDPFLRSGERLKIENIIAACNKKRKSCEKDSPILKIAANATESTGNRLVYITQQGELCNVEELACQYYRKQGYKCIHAENSIISSLYCILFWEIIFLDVPGVFIHQFQYGPLDFGTEEFYFSRKSHIDIHLENLSSKSFVISEFTRIFNQHFGEACLRVDWGLMSLDDWIEFLGCIDIKLLVFIMKQMATDYGSYRNGFPDLTAWGKPINQILLDSNETDDNLYSVKFIEVKSPNDRLSDRQLHWMQKLLAVRRDCYEICRIKNTE